MWLDSKAVNCPQKWGNFRVTLWGLLGAAEDSKSASRGFDSLSRHTKSLRYQILIAKSFPIHALRH